jgi:hypothetical protein
LFLLINLCAVVPPTAQRLNVGRDSKAKRKKTRATNE